MLIKTHHQRLGRHPAKCPHHAEAPAGRRFRLPCLPRTAPFLPAGFRSLPTLWSLHPETQHVQVAMDFTNLEAVLQDLLGDPERMQVDLACPAFRV